MITSFEALELVKSRLVLRLLFSTCAISLLSACNSGSSSSEISWEPRQVVLEWTPPEHRVDGTTLEEAEIDSYILRYGTDPLNLDQVIDIDHDSVKELRLDQLTERRYYFSVSVVDIFGLESMESEVISVSF